METVKYRGREIAIMVDDHPSNPRTEWDNAGTMACWHRRYNLGDEQPSCDPHEWRRGLAMEADSTVEERIEFWESGAGWERLINWYVRNTPSEKYVMDEVTKASDVRVDNIVSKALEKNYIMLPLYLYDHSGITMNTTGFSCGWDSGQVGVIYISKKDAIKEWGKKKLTKKVRERAIKYLIGEVESYDQYLCGEVYGYDTGTDSCWGFFGSDHEESGLLDAARSQIDYDIRAEKKAFIERKKVELKNRIPLALRTAYALI